MNGDKILIDTNAVIYLLNGDKTMAGILDQKNLYISFITQLELLAYPGIDLEKEKIILELIDNCTIIDINNSIKKEVIRLRRKYSLKLPDCIIAATALYFDLPLITADKDFIKVKELSLMLYEK